MRLPRILLTAPASGSGKTMITCGLLQALQNRQKRVISYKCGPDFIDPMFHRTVLHTPSRNLDTYFTNPETTRYLLMRSAAAERADLAVIEGVMGYYDGVGGMSDQASACDVARVTDTPAVLIVNCKGMSQSIIPLIQGFMHYRRDSRLQGVILNRMSSMLYPRMRDLIEKQLDIKVLGYVPETDILRLESRHLGLVMPSEIPGIQEQVQQLAELFEKTLDLDGILELAESASDIQAEAPSVPWVEGRPVIAVARDEAFCFYYEDNLELLRETGAQLIEFSPLHDKVLPACDGLLLGGGYPELYLKELSGNKSMLLSIRDAVEKGLPTLAECGGFMYLLDEMEDMDGISRPTVGALRGKAYRTKRLQRFGYIELHPVREQMPGFLNLPAEESSIRGHEFHYFDTTNNGNAWHAQKPLSDRGWECIQATVSLAAGFPHLYYYSNPQAAARFTLACADWHERKGTTS